ncbi:MAG TPA: DUF488 family protein [Chloroflexota bacterium]|nr:DUF488 family protein [Chloroflexota bacterium]
MERLYTIGAYGFDAERFLAALEAARIDLFLDIRRRRGVRGREYAFANAGRLQQELEARGIAYRHEIGLAPEQETRALQEQADRAGGVARRKRTELGAAFVEDYTRRTLQRFDWSPLLQELAAAQRPVLFCVEGRPEACHRHLVAERLTELTGVMVTNLLP